jgi:hypothetical protein
MTIGAAFYKRRDDGIVPLICPTCQNVFAGFAQSIHASDHQATLHGVVFDILVGSVHRVGLAAVFPDDDRRMACRAVARGPRSLSRREGFGFQSVFAFASLKLRRTWVRPDDLAWLAKPQLAQPIWSLSGGKTDVARTSRFCRCEQHFVPAHNPRALMCYCVRNLYVTIRATMLAKISSAGRDFRIVGLVEWRAADRPG